MKPQIAHIASAEKLKCETVINRKIL